jgi:hypothetical protein
MNWGTAIATIAARANKSATSEADRIKRQLCASCALHRRERLHFTQGETDLLLQVSVADYGPQEGLPRDVVTFVGDKHTLVYGGDENDRQPVYWVNRERMTSLRMGVVSNGTPYHWTFWGGKLKLWPPPDLSTHVFRAPYVKDAGTPTYRYEGGAWAFYNPEGVVITDTYSSPWFDQALGFDLITFHAEWKLWSSEWKGVAGQGEQAAQQYAEALSALQEITGLQTAARKVEPYTEGWE